VSTLVRETGKPARIDDFAQSSDEIADTARMLGVRSSVGAPISAGDQLWGVLTVASTGVERLPADTEARLAAFGELAAATIANAQARVELRGFAEEQAALRRVATIVARIGSASCGGRSTAQV
jgi:GAF domain-containing protein